MIPMAEFREAVAVVEKTARDLEPELLPTDRAQEMFDDCERLVRLVSGMRMRLAARLEDTAVWRREGFRRPEDWYARKTGTTPGKARDELDTGHRLGSLSGVDDAVRSGRLSAEQAKEVASGAEAAPQLEEKLLDAAEKGTVGQLKEKSRQARTAGEKEAERRERHRRNRCARHWQDSDGAGHIEVRGPIEDTAPIWKLIEAMREKLFHAARKAGNQEPVAAYGFDAATELIRRGAGAGSGDGGDGPVVPRMLNVLIDHEAWMRGHAEAGEACEIDGAGPISVAAVREMAEGSFLTLSLWDGADVHRIARVGQRGDVASMLDSASTVEDLLERLGVDVKDVVGRGRHIPAHLETALVIRDRTCGEPGCDARQGLETDHIDPVGWDVNGPTTYDNLKRRCRHHHSLKTKEDRKRYARAHGPPVEEVA